MFKRNHHLLTIVFFIFGAGAFAADSNRLVIYAFPDQKGPTINRNIYGHFSEHLGRCIYEGYWVGEDSSIPNTRGIRNDVVAALRELKVPVIRWPGGCFADEYHWMEGIGPYNQRPQIVNVHWGGVTENNHFGTHEFLDLCGQIGCEPYICGNVGSGTPREMRDWVEYITFDGKSPMADLRRKNGHEQPWKLTYFGVGNENWGCGGSMSPQYYSDLYKHFQTYIRNYSGNAIYKIAGGANSSNFTWTDVLMREIGNRMSGLSLHYYVRPSRTSGSRSATEFGEQEWFQIISGAFAMDDAVAQHELIMDRYDPDRRIAMIVDEWGTWYEVEPGTEPRFLYQQNSLRDALFAGVALNNFNKRSRRIQMTNIAQTINVLQAMILTDRGDMLLTPTYHVYHMYKVHQDAELLPTELTCGKYAFASQSIPSLNVSASRDKSGAIHVSLCNVDPNNAAPLTAELRGATGKRVSGQVLTAPAINSYNSFKSKDTVKPAPFNDVKLQGSVLTTTVPSKSVVTLEIQ